MTEDDRTFLRGMSVVLTDWGFPTHGQRVRAIADDRPPPPVEVAPADDPHEMIG